MCSQKFHLHTQFITYQSTFAHAWGMCDYKPLLRGPVLANNFAVSDIRDNTFGLLNRGCIVALPFLRTTFSVRQKSLEPSFWEEMDSFVLLAYPSLAASRVLLQDYYPVGTNKKSDFCEQWQQHKQLKATEMTEV